MQSCYRDFIGLSQYRPARNFELVEKELNVFLDGVGPCRFYMRDREELEVSFGSLKAVALYDCLKPDDDVYFVHAEIQDACPRRCLSFVIDAANSSFTLCDAIQDGEKVSHQFYFGGVQNTDGVYSEARTGFTDDLVGISIDFAYTSEFSYRHSYLDNNRVSWETILARKAGSSDSVMDQLGDGDIDYCRYIKINDHIYMFVWIEKKIHTQGVGVENFARLYYLGGMFGLSPDNITPEWYTFSAYGKPAPFKPFKKD